MWLQNLKSLPVILLAFVVPAAAFADDRPPSAEERQNIEATLSEAGYQTWEEIEFDDGAWEVDDARKGDSNREFDLKIDPANWRIASEREDL